MNQEVGGKRMLKWFHVLTALAAFAVLVAFIGWGGGRYSFQSFLGHDIVQGVSFESVWVKTGLALVFLNLLFWFVSRLIKFFRFLRGDRFEGGPLPRLKLRFDVELRPHGIEHLRKLWSRRGFRVVDSSETGFLVRSRKGWVSVLFQPVLPLLLMVVLGLFVWKQEKKMEGFFLVREGVSTNLASVLQGEFDWPMFQDRGEEFKDFYQAPWNLKLERLDASFYPNTTVEKSYRAEVEFADSIGNTRLEKMEPFRAVQYRDFDFRLASIEPEGAPIVVLRVVETGKQVSIEPGQSKRFGGFGAVEIVRIERDVERSGDMVRLKVVKGAGESRTENEFWLFENFPKFDLVNRKRSSLHFELKEVKQNFAAKIVFSKGAMNPLWPVLLIALCIAFLFYGWTYESFWISFSEKEVFVVGSTTSVDRSRLTLDRLRQRLVRELATAEEGGASA